jgi:hypothetical protein
VAPCANRRRSLTRRPERVSSQIKEADIKQIINLGQEEHQDQTTSIQTKLDAPTLPSAEKKTIQTATGPFRR